MKDEPDDPVESLMQYAACSVVAGDAGVAVPNDRAADALEWLKTQAFFDQHAYDAAKRRVDEIGFEEIHAMTAEAVKPAH